MARAIDERVRETKRKMASGGFGILHVGILIVILYRQLFLGQDFSEYGDIFVVWLAACFYVVIGEALQGVTPFGQVRVRTALVPGIMALTIVGVGLYQGTIYSWIGGVSVLFFAFVSSSIMLAFLYWLYRQWEKRTLGDE